MAAAREAEARHEQRDDGPARVDRRSAGARRGPRRGADRLPRRSRIGDGARRGARPRARAPRPDARPISSERLAHDATAPDAARASARAWLAEERERTDVAARDVAVERDRVEEEARAAGQASRGLARGAPRGRRRRSAAVESEISRLVGAIHERRAPRRPRAASAARSWCRRPGAPTASTPRRSRGAPRPRARPRRGARTASRSWRRSSRRSAPSTSWPTTSTASSTSGSRSSARSTTTSTASIKDLEKALRGMTRTAQERFTQAFEEINRHFGEIFAAAVRGRPCRAAAGRGGGGRRPARHRASS